MITLFLISMLLLLRKKMRRVPASGPVPVSASGLPAIIRKLRLLNAG